MMQIAIRGRVVRSVFFSLMFSTLSVAQAGSANVARLVVWQPKPGMTRDFEEGYKRHLDWHRKNNDSWTWHGWSITSGERIGYFVDGSFFHRWSDLDTPVSPAADSADNEINVRRYAEIRNAGIYEAIPHLTTLDPAQLSSPLLSFCYVSVASGRGKEFEQVLAEEMSRAKDFSQRIAVFRPVTGFTEYLLILPAEKSSGVSVHEEMISRIAQAAARQPKMPLLLEQIRIETGTHRTDLSYMSPSSAR